ncbi:MAG: ribonuclease III domain-containing protein [Eubacteriales bacterium]|nr:ribonuclease III domain-containing protein [Eubacteriales bacterium]
MEESVKKNPDEKQKLSARFIPDKTEQEAGSYSPLVLAFIGDSAYELLVRTMLVNPGNARPNDLNRHKMSLVKADAQSDMMDVIEPHLTGGEKRIYHRGRNAKSYTTAKNATIADYRRATGFEALIGYLYLTGQSDRMMELVSLGIDYVEEKQKAVRGLPSSARNTRK